VTTRIHHLPPSQPWHDRIPTEDCTRLVPIYVGVSFCVLTNPSPDIPYLEGYWLCSVRTFLASIHGSLEFADSQIQPKQHKGDIYLMNQPPASKLNPHELRRINLCRLFFIALTISDITNASGDRLSPGILDGTPLISQSQPKGPQVKQPSPSPRAWTAWRKLLHLVSDRQGILHIPHPLSQWTNSGNQLRRQWPFLYSTSSNSLYRSFEATFEVSGKVPHVFSALLPLGPSRSPLHTRFQSLQRTQRWLVHPFHATPPGRNHPI
jgi:hypothetical protein